MLLPTTHSIGAPWWWVDVNTRESSGINGIEVSVCVYVFFVLIILLSERVSCAWFRSLLRFFYPFSALEANSEFRCALIKTVCAKCVRMCAFLLFFGNFQQRLHALFNLMNTLCVLVVCVCVCVCTQQIQWPGINKICIWKINGSGCFAGWLKSRKNDRKKKGRRQQGKKTPTLLARSLCKMRKGIR